MEDSPRGRAKPQKMRVTFPDGTVYCYSSVKETFLATLRKIGADRLSRVKLEVCHLPMFSKKVYDLYKDFMEPIGEGWYANIQGSTYNRYSQLVSINNQLDLGLTIDLSEDIKGERISRGPKAMVVLEVTFPDHTVIGEENTAETFMQCIWHLGIDRVRKLNLKQGGKDLITSAKLYKGQVQIDTNRWLIVPAALKDKVKILRVIGAMLHVKMDITSFSTGENKSYKRIGSKSSHRQEVEDIRKQTGGKFNLGDHVYNEAYGEGIVLNYESYYRTYKVQFSYKFFNLPKEKQIYIVREQDLEFIRNGAVPKPVSNQHRISKNIRTETDSKPPESPRRESEIKTESPAQEETRNVVGNFKTGDVVLNSKYGKGKIISHPYDTHVYNVQFFSLKGSDNTRFINENDLVLTIQKGTNSSSKSPSNKESENVDKKRYNTGDKVWNKRYGIGIVLDYYPKIHDYKVRFQEAFHDMPVEKQSILIHEKFIEPYRRGIGNSSPTLNDHKIIAKQELKETRAQKMPNVIPDTIKRHSHVFKEGDIVSHKKFGIGTVRHFFNGSNTYEVQFPGLPATQQEKTLKGEDLNLVREYKGGTILVSATPRKAQETVKRAKENSFMNNVESTTTVFKKGDSVYNERYGTGKILDYFDITDTYKVRFQVKYKGRIMFDKTCMMNEEDLKPLG